jgi:hypothetical protein
MPARLNWQKVRACDGSRTAAVEPEETLVHDARVGVTPAQMVEHKLMALLKNSYSGAFTRSSELIDVERKQKALFQMADAAREDRQRAAAGRRIEDSAVKELVPFLQRAKAPLVQSALAEIRCP